MPQKRCAIYCRVSTHDQSCDRQERDLTEFATRAGYEVIEIFKETASGAKDNRPERKKVITLAQKRQIDIVLVTELTRWGRSTQDLIHTLDELHARDVSLIVQSGMNFDLSTAQGRLVRTFFAALAEFERDLNRERVLSGIAAAQAKGTHCGRKPGTGKYTTHKNKVLSLRSEGYTIREIAKNLKLSPRTVQKILNLERDLKLGKSQSKIAD
jgi:putative DNA-invertase from lambdoid prophage Rac